MTRFIFAFCTSFFGLLLCLHVVYAQKPTLLLTQLSQATENTPQGALRIYQDQYGRMLYVNDQGQIVRVEEPPYYSNGVIPPPVAMSNQGPIEGGLPYDNISPSGNTHSPSFQKNTPDYNAPAIELPRSKEIVASVQILMHRIGASPGVIDGVAGGNFDKASAAAGEISGRFIDPNDQVALSNALERTGGPAFSQYHLTHNDIYQNYAASIPTDYAQKAQMPAMSYTSVREMLAEKFHIDEIFLQELNPHARFNMVGEIIKVPNLRLPKRENITRIVADKTRKQVRGYNSQGRLIVAYPSTIGSIDNPSPSGTVEVERIAVNPNYTYNPKVNFKQGNNDRVLIIPPGPNGPVGTVWIALSKPTYGIHGTPEPSRIGKTSSHGCIRLTNWDAEELAKLVKKGVKVHFIG
ncbi:L,D-transpeptidase [Bartonella tamiae]|uniref:L,D-TPase catalytic domain-containing protein n=1 Tax=Bartonella tamiae Th239 TaxID=1094558 RepID=J0QZU3_9HYPH|nr:L,D-transpeptidase [Bartonella tamiae]EJF91701.1 hypothetical protein ME5_00080 [Bartonella tamiae Th239]EJF92632.1 hypothetical protein MEG_01802 [Bartonella tamiae Th307]